MKIWNSLQYTETEIEDLKRMYAEYLPLRDIGIALHRSQASVAQKVRKLKIKRDWRVVQLVSYYGLDILEKGTDRDTVKALLKQKRIEERQAKQLALAKQHEAIAQSLLFDLANGIDRTRAIKAANRAGLSVRKIVELTGISSYTVQSTITSPRRYV